MRLQASSCRRTDSAPETHSFTTTLRAPWSSCPSCSLPRSASSSTSSRRRARTSCARPACSSGCSSTGPTTRELARDVVVCEQEGDRITHDIIQRLNQTFVTPIDREDIYALASGLDDIVDWIEEVADFFALYRIEAPMEPGAAAGADPQPVVPADRAGAIPRLRAFEDIHHFTVEINRYENEGDRVVREALASLFEAGIDPMLVIRWKDIFERLEDAIDATETRGEHPRGDRDQEHLVAAARRRPLDRRRDGARVRLHERVPRHRERGRDVDLDARAVAAAWRSRSPPALNFVGAFISLAVAATIATGIVNADLITPAIVFAGLIGAIAWNLATWYFGLPSSSSHALIGGVVGAAFVAEGRERGATATGCSTRSSSRRSWRPCWRSSPRASRS